MRKNFDAIIIGGGPAGASAAILLAEAGWRVAVIEQHSFPRRKVCGECLAASNLPLLARLGVGNAFAELAGPPLREVALISGERTVRAALPPLPHDDFPWGAALGRETLDTLLLAQAARSGADVFQPWTAREIEGTAGHVECHIVKTHAVKHATTQATLCAPVLIAAHGSWRMREAITELRSHQRLPSRDTDLFAFKANYARSRLEPGLLPVLSFPGGYGGMVLGDAGMATLAFCIRRDTLARCRANLPGETAARAALAHILQHCHGVYDAFESALPRGQWLGVGPLRPGIRLGGQGSAENGAAFLIGNAAGEAHPIIGEGMSMAMQSAWLLASILAPCKAEAADPQQQAALRQAYARSWRRQFSTRIALAAMFAHVAMRPALSSAAMMLLQRYPQLLTHAASWCGKTRSIFEEASPDAASSPV